MLIIYAFSVWGDNLSKKGNKIIAFDGICGKNKDNSEAAMPIGSASAKNVET